MVMPNRWGHSNTGNTMRSGIDLFGPEELHDAAELGELELLARVVSMIEAGRPSWHADAACRGSDVDFHSKAPKQRAAAFTLCGGCEVRAECLEWATFEVADFTPAVLGGLDGQARRRLADERNRNAMHDRNQSATTEETPE